jgi:hypothetical protein
VTPAADLPRANASLDTGYAQVEGSQEDQDLATHMQTLQFGSNNPYNHPPATTPPYNPFAAQAQNPFSGLPNGSGSNGQRPSRRSAPAVGYGAQGSYTTDSMSGFLGPNANPGFALQSPDRRTRRGSQTPAPGNGQAHQNGGSSIRRPQTSQGRSQTSQSRPQTSMAHSSSRSSDHSSVLPLKKQHVELN